MTAQDLVDILLRYQSQGINLDMPIVCEMDGDLSLSEVKNVEYRHDYIELSTMTGDE